MTDSYISTHHSPMRVLLMDCLGAAIFLFGVLIVASIGSRPSLMLVLEVAVAFALALRRTAPLMMLYGCTLLSAIQHIMFSQIDGIVYFCTLIGVFSVAAFAQRNRIQYCVVPPLLAMLLLALQLFTSWLPEPLFIDSQSRADVVRDPLPIVVIFGAIVVAFTASWALGMLRRGQLVEAQRQRELAVTDERSRIAREMHDIIAHSLASIITLAEGGRLTAKQQPELAGELFAKIGAAGRDALGDVKVLLRNVDSPQDDAPAQGVDAIAELVERVRVPAGPGVTFTEVGERVELPKAMQLALFRVAQEAHTNMLKHAPGAGGEIELRWQPETVQLRALNALTPGANPPASDHRGLAGMRERVELFGGTLEVTRTDASFEVLATLPIPATRASKEPA